MIDSELRKRIAKEARNAFDRSKDPSYPMATDAYAATLFDLLNHKIGDKDLDGTGPQVVAALSAYFIRHELSDLLSKAEAFAKFLLRFIAPDEYERRREEAKNKMAFASALKGLKLLSKTDLESAPESLCDSPHFAEHIVRTFQARNRLAHGAPEFSERETADIFESVCVFLLFAVAEHHDAVRASLLVARSEEYLRNLEREFGNWQNNFEQCELHLKDKHKRGDASADLHDRLTDDSYEAAVENPKLIADAIKTYSQLLLLGASGAGKSTTLQFLAGTMAQTALRDPSSTPRIPVYVLLNGCSPENGRTVRVIVNEIAASWKRPDRDVFEETFLLLDGLNELATHSRARVVEEVSALLHAYSQLPIVITSRSSEDGDVLGLPCVELQPLSDQKIKGLLEKQGNDFSVESLINALRGHSKLWNWARTPLHLKMFAESAEDFGSELPGSLGELMQIFTRHLMRREHRQGQQTIETTKETLLAALAFGGMTQNQRSLSKNDAIRILKEARDRIGAAHVDVPEFLAEVIDNDLLGSLTGDEVTFKHDWYQEYFAALEIRNREEVQPMLPKTLQADPRWEHVLILFSSLTTDRVRFFSEVSGVNPRLTSRALASRLANEPEVTELVQRRARSQSSPEHLLLLAELGDIQGFGSAVTAVPEYDDRYLNVFFEVFNRAEHQKPRNEWEGKTEPEWHRVATVMVEALIQAKAADTLTKLAASVGFGKLLNVLGLATEGIVVEDAISRRSRASTLTLVRRCYEAAIDLGDSAAAAQFGAHLVSGTEIDADIPRGIALILSAAQAGYPPAMVDLSDLKFGGIHCSKNPREAEDWLRRAAKVGDPAAMRILGERLLDANELPKNAVEGKDWLARAAAAGLASAMLKFASRLFEGNGVQKDLAEGERWLRSAVAAGDEFAKWDLGYRLLDGEGIVQDAEQGTRILGQCAFEGGPLNIQLAWLGTFDKRAPELRHFKFGPKWLIKAANAGLPRAMCILGNRYRAGRGIPRDYKKAAYWLKKAAEAEDIEAMGNYGQMLLDGDHVPQSAEEGERWLRKAVQHDVPFSRWLICDLAERLIMGKTLPRNLDEGADWLGKSLEIGVFPGPESPLPLPGSKVMSWITAMFVGDKLPLRPDIAQRLLRKAAQCGWPWPMRELGIRLDRGEGVDRDPKEGAEWLLKAAQAGDECSMFLYGRLRLEGGSISQNVGEGALWLERSAKKGFPEAMKELGNRMIEGVGFGPNPTEGLKWLSKAAERGHPAAMSDLGRRLYFGNPMAKDEQKGILLAKRAALAGDVGAKAFVAIAALETDDGRILEHGVAVQWLTQAANEGHVKAALNLALRLFQAEGLPADSQRAERLVRNLANAGEPVAMRILGVLLYEGDHLAANREEALEWIKRAADAGDIQAKEFLGKHC